MPDQKIPTKAECAAAARQARKAAQEAAALRANLHKRKIQARAAHPPIPQEGTEKCQ
jgi:hypothetical protein